MHRNSGKVKWKKKRTSIIEYTSVVMLLNRGWALPCFAKALRNWTKFFECKFLYQVYVTDIRLLKIYYKCQSNGILLSREIRIKASFLLILLLSLKTRFCKKYEKIFGNNGTRLTTSRSPNYSKKEKKKKQQTRYLFIWIYYRYSKHKHKHNSALLFFSLYFVCVLTIFAFRPSYIRFACLFCFLLRPFYWTHSS